MWTVFAARGMGFYASTTGAEDVSPQQDFEPAPLPNNGTLTGFVQDAETGEPLVGAVVNVGGLARPHPHHRAWRPVHA